MGPARGMHEVAIRHTIGGRDVEVGFRYGLRVRGPRQEHRQPRASRHDPKLPPCHLLPTQVVGVVGNGSLIAHGFLLANRNLLGGGGSFLRWP